MKMRKARTKRELFINILDMWLQNEITVIGEYCTHNISGEQEKAREEYKEYMKLYDLLGDE